jgi:ABC-2 type transport system permease protein
MSWTRIGAIVRKDATELLHRPGTLVPPLLLLVTATLPAFFVAVFVPAWTGERLDDGELAAAARAAATRLPALAALPAVAQVQVMLFQQFLLLWLTAPVAGTMALAAQSVIGEKQARTLEPLLATPLKTSELLVAKALTPLALSMALHLLGVGLYVAGIAALAEPGVAGAFVNPSSLLILFGIAPLVTLLSLQLAVILSSRVNDPRSAQQLGALIVLPMTGLFVAQLIRGFLVGDGVLLAVIAALAALNAIALVVGVRVFDRERILLAWK